MEIDQYCFACGRDNPIGLKLRFEYTDEGVVAQFIPAKEYQGFVNILHGGIITTLLDEAMAHAVIAKGRQGVTARLEVKFKKPVVMDEMIVIKGQILWEKGRIIKASAEIHQSEEIKATATADFFIMDTIAQE
jgi:acyl-coenzyme A thioesterase PaaI-like protein